MSYRIYALVDEWGTPRYVGQTRKTLRLRLQQHRSAAKRLMRPLDLWLKECPLATIVILESTNDPDEAERRWINQIRAGGIQLLNLKEGGRNAGIAHRDETKAALSRSHTGKTLTADHRAKLSRAHTGVPLGDAHRSAIGRGGKGLKRTEESRARISAAKMGDLNPMSAKRRAERQRASGEVM